MTTNRGFSQNDRSRRPSSTDPVAALRAALRSRRPVDERESSSVVAFLEALDHLDRPFSEEADPTHVTGSAIVVGPRGVVLHRHKRLGLWLQPGGHLEPGETPWEAARREAAEETGLEVQHAAGPDHPQLVHVDVHPGGRGHTHLDLRYLFVADDVEPAPPEGESQDVGWFAWDDAIELADDGLAGGLRALSGGSASTVQVRRATPEDAPAVAELYLRSRRHALPTVRAAHTDDDVRRWMTETVVPAPGTSLASVAGVPVGLLVCEAGWVDQLYVDPPWIGRGIGSLLLAEAKQRHPDGLELWTFQVNTGARRFYEQRGFVEVERSGGAGNEEREPDVRYVWPDPATARAEPDRTCGTGDR